MSYTPKRSTKAPPRIDPAMLDAHRGLIRSIDRRRILTGGLSLGALTMLTGCDVTDESSVNKALQTVSGWNDRAQALLFDRDKLAPTYAEAQAVRPPHFNAFYDLDDLKPVAAETWTLDLAGAVADKTKWTVDRIAALPRTRTIVRHVCVEGWDYIGDWSGPLFKTFLERVGADLTKPFVGFHCADGYTSSIDMACALHPQTILATHYANTPITDPYGLPLRLRTSTKLGFKNPKWITAIEVTDTNPGGYWEDRGYNWFAGL
jgi:DMSO/TMAO reductase YedYZ molybdopterin-dependent catalytic subunit